MAMEAISKTAVTYQGSVSVPETAEAPKTAEVTVQAPTVSTDAAADNTAADAGQVKQETVKRAVEEINKNAKNSEAVFGIHEATNRITIKIVDKDTKEVVKEFPPEKTLDMIAKVWEMAGLMVDEKL